MSESGQAILTLVGEELRDSDAGDRLARAVAGSEAFIVPSHHSPRCVSIAVPMAELEFHLELLGRLFFSAPDARFFAEVNAAKFGCISEEAAAEVCVPAKTGHAPRRLVARESLA